MRVYIVEDHEMFREAIRKVCAAQFGHEVVGESASGVEAVAAILTLKPEVVILDLSLPDMDGFNIVDRVAAKLPRTRFLVLSSHCDDYTLFRVERAQVSGFLDKTSNSVQTLRKALQEISEGREYFSERYVAARQARKADPRSFAKLLTERERAVLTLIGRGLSDEEVGACLEISPRTVQTHRGNLLTKLQLKGTPKLIAFAIEHGFTQVAPRAGDQPSFP